ncbi:condensin complex subunit 2/barren [Lipomyces orientalis]|uniref:Condensin complex subunit 2/barren n=1 Tax=Lipomyces orientalis TaxID=1233043 RepID=A0ACC3TY74_9ASCO
MPRQSYLSHESTSEPARRSKKVINRQSLSPVKQYRLSSTVSTPMLNDDRSEKLMRTTSRRNALNEINKNILTNAATPLRTSDGRNKDSEDNSAYNTPRVPILSNFEEWMKLATDNKINATNSWNFALIDYFHDMSLLKEGNGINFQKASCTLDGCVKIYTSRIDSVATETGKLLSGLSDHSSKQRKRGEEDDVADGDGNSEEREGVTSKAKRRVRSEATLVKDFSLIQVKKLDLEFAVDPLFKKASADFDEGGAKGLLFNHLSIDNSGRVVFDTSEDAKVNQLDAADATLNGPTKQLDLDPLRERYFSDILDDLDNKFISPSLKDFEFPADPNAVPLDIPFLRSFDDGISAIGPSNLHDDNGFNDDSVNYPVDEYDPPLDGDDIPKVKEEFGNGGDLWLSNIKFGAEVPQFDDGFGNGIDGDNADEKGYETGDNLGSYVLQFVQNQSGENENDIFAYFDDSIKKNWTGLQHWRIQKAKKDAEGTKKPQQPRQSRKKEEFIIDFLNDDEEVDEDALFEQGNPSSSLLPKSQWRSETRNLLEEEVIFNSKKLLRLFLKPRVQLHFFKAGERRSSSGADEPLGSNMAGNRIDTYVHNPEDDFGPQSLDDDSPPQTYDANFFNDDGFDPGHADVDRSFVDAVERLDEYSTEISPLADDNAGSNTMTPDDATVNNEGNLTTIIRREEAQEEFEFGSQLVLNGGRKFKTDYVNYARVAKKVDVKKLKDNLWTTLAYDRSTAPEKVAEVSASRRSSSTRPDPIPEEKPKLFSEIVGGLKEMYPAKAMADISTSFCFICLLHLANEKGLEIQNNKDFKDLAIHKDLTAVIDEY